MRVEGWFGEYRGVAIGVWGQSPPSLQSREALALELDRVLHTLKGSATLIAGGPESPERIGIITGAAGSMIATARDAGLDTFITGEGPHHSYFDAMEWGAQRDLCGTLCHRDARRSGDGITSGRAVRYRLGLP